MQSTHSAEAWNCSDAMDNLFWTRQVLAELFDKHFNSKEHAVAAQRCSAGLSTDCKSDCVTRDRVQLLDRRLSPEAAIIREDAQHCVMKWVKSDQQVADCPTKDVTTPCARVVFASNQWKIGPDECAPINRLRSFPAPPDDGLIDFKEAERLTKTAWDHLHLQGAMEMARHTTWIR